MLSKYRHKAGLFDIQFEASVGFWPAVCSGYYISLVALVLILKKHILDTNLFWLKDDICVKGKELSI